MHPSTSIKIIGLMTALFSLAMLPVILVAMIYREPLVSTYWLCFMAISCSGLILWFPNRKASNQVKHIGSFFIVTAIWFIYGSLGALPFIIILNISFSAAFFETVSGLTTAGATVVSNLDELPPSILFYRQLLQWLGGMGIIVLFVALFPALNIGGLRLFKAEIPGPKKDEKLTPRLVHTAQYLWLIYFILTALCALAFWWAGMSVFDAICHSLTTISTGGFSTHDASLGYFNSPAIEGIAIVFMMIGAINFSLHFIAFRKGVFRQYFHDAEVVAFSIIVVAAILLATATLHSHGYYSDSLTAFRYAAFEVVSFITSTGFGIADYSQWPTYLPLFLLLIGFAGGCAGSTAGGMKIVRVMFIGKGILRELQRIVHPNAIIGLKHNTQNVDDATANTILAFMFFYAMTALIFTLAMMLTGLDMVSSFGAVAASLNVCGPGLGETVSSFAGVTDTGKWICSIAMIVGRLEIFTLLVLFHPSYWKAIYPVLSSVRLSKLNPYHDRHWR